MHVRSPRISPRILRFLPDEQLAEFERSHNTVLALWPDLSIAYVNPAWIRFALENDGEPAISRSWSVGACMLDAIAPPVRSFFEVQYRECLTERRVWDFDYECSSADRYRVFHLRVAPTPGAEALISIHTPRIDFDCVRDESPPILANYLQADGAVRQCCECRRFQRFGATDVFDWVPSWIRRRPQQVRQVLCPNCRSFYGINRDMGIRHLPQGSWASEGMSQ
jgi:hypothetical protein